MGRISPDSTKFTTERSIYLSKLFMRYASMNAGKSTALLQVAFNYEESGKRTACFTAAIDDRMGVATIGSRIGLRREASTYDSKTVFDPDNTAIVIDGKSVDCVLVDEAQFLTLEQVRQLHRLANVHGVPVICYGLRSDFRGNAFEGSTALLTLADEIEEMKAICSRCSRKASMNMRVDSNGRKMHDGEQISIGGNESYRAVCPACFYKADA